VSPAAPLPPECNGNHYLTTPEVAALLRKPVDGLYKMIRLGDAPERFKVGRSLIWRCTDVVEWINNHREE
jgi:predicted DNA-binding transcriptional regulator AlpA